MLKLNKLNHIMMSKSRRDFLRKGAVGALGFSILPAVGNSVAASDKLRVAQVGVGGMGNNHLGWFAALSEVDVVALCDVDSRQIANGLKNLKELQTGVKVDTYSDFRKVLERKDIDAICCATPDHWHAPVATLAFQAGKDVYGEKPLSYDVKEGQTMLEQLNKYQRVFQLGTQIHAQENYHRVVDIIQSGVLGKIHTVRLWKNQHSPIMKATPNATIPTTLDWDMWLGAAPYVDYDPGKCHRTYRYFLDYSGGIFADFWCHIADIVWWSISPKGLKTITAKGGTPKGIGDAPEWVDADFDFDDLLIHWTTKPPKVPGARERNIGAYFEGNKGTLICDYYTKSITINGETVEDLPDIPKITKRSPGHQQNFVDAVKTREQPQSNLAYVRKMTLPMHLAIISWRLGRKLQWDDDEELFVNDEAANSMLHRAPRDKWALI
jgi:predicted dehydrogenase